MIAESGRLKQTAEGRRGITRSFAEATQVFGPIFLPHESDKIMIKHPQKN